MNLFYWLNVVVLFGAFIMSILLFLELFAVDSLAYTLGTVPRNILKLVLIMLCVGQLHAIDGDAMEKIKLHHFLRDFGQFGLLFFTHLYLMRRRQARKN